MKSKLFLTVLAVGLSLCGYSQTKGTNALGFGVSTGSQKSSNSSAGTQSESKINNYSISYGHFIKDNTKIGLELSYSKNTVKNFSYADQKAEGYGGNLNYQQYFQIYKTLYAFAGGAGGYFFNKQSYDPFTEYSELSSKNYNLSAYGGVTWFFSKRFALETSLLSANINYSKTKQANWSNGMNYSSKSTSFNLSTSGAINDLGFKIYLLF